MALESKCHNCGKEITAPGHVYRVFYPFLFIVLAFPPGGRFCQPCATTINVVGFYVSLAGVVALMAIVFWQLGK